ncbi:MAG: inorganic phosphate transporter, partial [Azoarcus sp.]|nr:inorganic phosphate transporter [Azoarcus sp.]
NWQKALDIVLSLILSPLAGFVVAGLLLLAMKRWRPISRMHAVPKIHATPEVRMDFKIRKKPPFWSRLVLVLSAIAVSFVHGSNDGQKGVGLIMLVLICFVPTHYVLDLRASPYQIERTRDAAKHIQHFYQHNQNKLGEAAHPPQTQTDAPSKPYRCEIARTTETIQNLMQNLKDIDRYTDLDAGQRVQVRRDLLCLDDMARQVSKLAELDPQEKADLNRLRKDLTITTEYAPIWVIFAIATALGLGTVVGWRRVVLTVGERIGKQGMTYAQGMSAQITAALAIGVANLYSLPVSTTHVLSSGVAGAMVANRSGLHFNTIKAILLAWVLTFPVAMLLAAALFWLTSWVA